MLISQIMLVGRMSMFHPVELTGENIAKLVPAGNTHSFRLSRALARRVLYRIFLLRHLSQKEGEKIVAESLALLKEGKSEVYVNTYAKDKAAAAAAA